MFRSSQPVPGPVHFVLLGLNGIGKSCLMTRLLYNGFFPMEEERRVKAVERQLRLDFCSLREVPIRVEKMTLDQGLGKSFENSKFSPLPASTDVVIHVVQLTNLNDLPWQLGLVEECVERHRAQTKKNNVIHMIACHGSEIPEEKNLKIYRENSKQALFALVKTHYSESSSNPMQAGIPIIFTSAKDGTNVEFLFLSGLIPWLFTPPIDTTAALRFLIKKLKTRETSTKGKMMQAFQGDLQEKTEKKIYALEKLLRNIETLEELAQANAAVIDYAAILTSSQQSNPMLCDGHTGESLTKLIRLCPTSRFPDLKPHLTTEDLGIGTLHPILPKPLPHQTQEYLPIPKALLPVVSRSDRAICATRIPSPRRDADSCARACDISGAKTTPVQGAATRISSVIDDRLELLREFIKEHKHYLQRSTRENVFDSLRILMTQARNERSDEAINNVKKFILEIVVEVDAQDAAKQLHAEIEESKKNKRFSRSHSPATASLLVNTPPSPDPILHHSLPTPAPRQSLLFAKSEDVKRSKKVMPKTDITLQAARGAHAALQRREEKLQKLHVGAASMDAASQQTLSLAKQLKEKAKAEADMGILGLGIDVGLGYVSEFFSFKPGPTQSRRSSIASVEHEPRDAALGRDRDRLREELDARFESLLGGHT